MMGKVHREEIQPLYKQGLKARFNAGRVRGAEAPLFHVGAIA